MRILSILAAALIVSSVTTEGRASGFQVYFEQSAAAMGQAGAVVARGFEPSALFYNPAAITSLPGVRAQVHLDGLVQRGTHLQPVSGSTDVHTSLSSKAVPIGSLYFTEHMANGVAFGLAINTPYGSQTDWPDGWSGRYYADKTTLRTVYATPTLGYQLSKHLSVGLGVSLVWGEAVLERAINAPLVLAMAAPDLASAFVSGSYSTDNDVLLHLAGDDWGYGARLGAHWRISDRWSFGAAYESPVTLKLKGHASYAIPDYDDNDFGKIPGAGSSADQLAAGLFPDCGIQTEVRLPPTLSGGLAVQATDNLVLETDVTWTGWSSYRDLTVVFDHLMGASGVESTAAKDWVDVFAYRLGLEYRLSEEYVGRAGYAYDRSPVPDSTRDPSLPGADRHDLTVGLGYHAWGWQLDASYLYAIFTDAPSSLESAQNGNLAGSYETTAHVFAMSLGMRFQ